MTEEEAVSQVAQNLQHRDQGAEDTQNRNVEVAKVSIRIPPFWHAKPELWMAQVESQFIAAGITSDKTKYHTVVAAIESNVLAQISDIILNPPNSELYTTLKNRIITQFADSEQKRVKKLLQEQELGDMRPSQLLREMRSLAGSEINDNILKSIWMSRLPSNMRLIISISNEPLDKVALLADKICEVSDTPHVHVVETPDTAARSQSSIEQQLAEITKEIASIKANINRRHRSRSRNRPPSRSDMQNNNSNGLCWYHHKFGNDAKKCRNPCVKKLN
ncbi:uncharacterized protein LOC125778731 [Bactrocera dorsalis]|uniref:Uncharacterized protein LOC125778731 n=1 Tax=Bactrocera dorsalis TaxID=27457 RepID=A0ABM3JX69_BACDO|nr:uncharacterized protein LOC125778731 [Bactrocera dorsalis]